MPRGDEARLLGSETDTVDLTFAPSLFVHCGRCGVSGRGRDIQHLCLGNECALE